MGKRIRYIEKNQTVTSGHLNISSMAVLAVVPGVHWPKPIKFVPSKENRRTDDMVLRPPRFADGHGE